VYCHCERSEAISHFRLLRRVVYPELDEGLLVMTAITVYF